MASQPAFLDPLRRLVGADNVLTSPEDLVAVGARALSKTERLHLGSVSDSVLKYAPCSVLVARSKR
ncbi:MAG TPA: universal stress protein, partial [Verrucomicrobiota bacterium]|nr:universal stress protein [Verrucomicrobiota bacterium]